MRVRCHTDGSVWRVTLEPSPKSQDVVLDGDGLDRLHQLLDDAESQQCRVMILQGQAGQFCKGMDLRFLTQHAGEDLSRRLESYARCMARIRDANHAVVAVVDGDAMGGGVGMAAAADYVIATSRAVFAFPEVVLGLIPAMVLPLLCQRMPLQKARWLALSGSKVKAAEAFTLGLVDHVAEGPIEIEQRLKAVIKQMLRANPRSVAKLKRFATEVANLDCAEALQMGAEHTAKDLLELETIAAIRGLLANESPPWFERYKPGGRS